MAEYVYPAMFREEVNGSYSVEFPDIDGCYTGGDNLSEAMEYAVRAAKESLVLLALAKAENIEISQEEFDKAAKEYVDLYSYGSVEEFLSSVDIDQFREYILTSKVQEFIADNAIGSLSGS